MAVEAQLMLYWNQVAYIQNCFLHRILVLVIFLLNGSLDPSYFKSLTLALLSDVFHFYTLFDTLAKEEEKSRKLGLQLPIPLIQHSTEFVTDIRHVFGLMKDIIEKYNCSADDVLLINELLLIMNIPSIDSRCSHTYIILHGLIEKAKQGTLTPDDISTLYMIRDLLCTIYKPFDKTMVKFLVKFKEFNHIVEDYIRNAERDAIWKRYLDTQTEEERAFDAQIEEEREAAWKRQKDAIRERYPDIQTEEEIDAAWERELGRDIDDARDIGISEIDTGRNKDELEEELAIERDDQWQRDIDIAMQVHKEIDMTTHMDALDPAMNAQRDLKAKNAACVIGLATMNAELDAESNRVLKGYLESQRQGDPKLEKLNKETKNQK